MALSPRSVENCLKAADSALALLLFFPSMVCYWRGIWDLVGVATDALDEPLKSWVAAAIGSCTVFGYFLHPWMGRLLATSRKWVYALMSRVYLFLFAAVYMTYWRGVWSLGDYYMNSLGLQWDLIGLFICMTPLLLLRTGRTVVFPPCLVSLDTRKDVFVATTCFQVKTTRKPLYVLDSIFTHFVVMTLTIMTWRCAWSAFGRWAIAIWGADEWGYATAEADVWSLIIGLICVGFLFLIQDALGRVSIYLEEKNIGHSKLVYEDIAYLVVFFSLIWLWRGGWNLNARYMIADYLVGGAVNFVVGTILLMGLQLFSYVSACGCGLDGYDTNGEAFFPLNYLRVYLLPRLVEKRSPQSYEVEPSPRPDQDHSAGITVYAVSDGVPPTIRGRPGLTPMSGYGANGDTCVYYSNGHEGTNGKIAPALD